MNRRKFLRATGGALLGSAVLPPALAAQAPVAPRNAAWRPNILFCISDDQSWAHTSIAGETAIQTPAFDRVAREGVLFPNAFCSAPSCSPSRAAILTGRNFCELEEGGNLLSTLPKKFDVYPDLLEAAGYAVGFSGKGWGPGDWRPGGRTRNLPGPQFDGLEAFLGATEKEQPFCFWLGGRDPHRPYEAGAGLAAGFDPAKVRVPPFLPDAPEVRSDILDYLFEVRRWDGDVGAALALLEARGQLENTIVVVTSDNGMPFPRCKTNLYDYGAKMPLAVRWPSRVAGGRTATDFVNLIDFAPTFLQAAGLSVPPAMTGRTLLPLLTGGKSGRVEANRDRVYIGRERHDVFRKENGQPLGYPMRAVRTDEYLYIRNFHPERAPALDTPDAATDNDRGPTKTFVATHRDDPRFSRAHQLCYGLRPPEELYDVRSDPDQIVNLAGQDAHAATLQTLQTLRADLGRWMQSVGDPRAGKNGDVFDSYPAYSNPGKKPGAE